jgi:hypothetical protein
MGKLPADACPYPRPFREGFSDCAVFDRIELRNARAASAASQPRRLVSCRNLLVGRFWNGAQHHYGKCRLGDSGARLELVKHQILQADAFIDMTTRPESSQPGHTPIVPPSS